MAHEWHRGVLTASSWHGLEEVGVMSTADDIIAHGERSGAYPVSLRFEDTMTASGLKCPARALVASYTQHPDAALSCVGGRYHHTTVDGWRSLIRAAVEAGGRPTGAFALRDGTRALATFEVGVSNGLRTNFMLCDAFDGSMRLTTGSTAIRVVCANTLAVAMSNDGAGMAALRHTASLESKIAVLRESIGAAIQTGAKVRDLYETAARTSLTREQADAIFDKLFPKADEKETERNKSRADNIRSAAYKSSARSENAAGATLATLWNAATWMVDRDETGAPRAARGGSDRLDSLLFGTRADRVAEIQTIIEVVLRDGKVQEVPASDALSLGADKHQVGRKVLDDMLAGLS